jgi:1-acyl-sn-glycerol-3-phosphate acyltransferase
MKTVYYSDPIHDDFACTGIRTEDVTEAFRYINNHIVWRTAAFLLYHFVARPLILLYCKIIYGMRIRGLTRVLKLKGGFFIYGNHTHIVDSFIPNLLAFPKRKNYIIANPDAVSIPGLKNIVMMLGAIPIPTTIKGMKKYMATIKKRIDGGACVTIYPEAHIWPYYTRIRPFTDKSFYYPVELKVPVITFCNTYSRRKILRFIKTPKMNVYISEPMYPNSSLSPKEAQADLRNRVYLFMKQTAEKHSNYEYIRYIQHTAYSGGSDNKPDTGNK